MWGVGLHGGEMGENEKFGGGKLVSGERRNIIMRPLTTRILKDQHSCIL